MRAGAGGSPEVTDGPTTGDGAMDDLTEADVHDLPETASTDRVHRLERDCWCEPEVIEQQAGWAYVVHHTVQEVLAAHADAPMNPPRAGSDGCEVIVRAPERHACRPGWESHYSEGDDKTMLPPGWYLRPLDLPAGTVVQCDCGRVWVADAMKPYESPGLVMGRIRWRPEKRRERRRRLRNG